VTFFDELPVLEPPRPPRADAVRNREAILAAAQRLIRECGPDGITMERLAEEAGVGKGTLFRRFGDRAGLFHALLDESERELQEGFLRGPPPLGPGADPCARLVAFGDALIELTAARGEVLLAATPTSPEGVYRSAVYGAYRAHVSALLSQLDRRPTGYLADVLLAALSPALIVRQLDTGLSRSELRAAWEALARSVAGVG
jgi:AcrR family transcriptional regulator